jgi:hypothetical protein
MVDVEDRMMDGRKLPDPFSRPSPFQMKAINPDTERSSSWFDPVRE